MTSPIICAGFHRSGTSLAAQILHLSGMPFAIEPMQGNISNPDGHFEDLFAMRLHDQRLIESGTTWQFHGECNIRCQTSTIDSFKRYADYRCQLDGSGWLVKDPRATLFLQAWQSALNGKAVSFLWGGGSLNQWIPRNSTQQIPLPLQEEQQHHIDKN